MAKYTSPCAIVPRAGLPFDASETLEVLGRPLQCSSLSLSGAARRQWSLGVEVGQHARSAFHAVPDFNFESRGRVQQNIDARSEFDEADAFSALHMVANLLVEDDPPRQKTCDLLENHSLAIAFHRYYIL